MIRNKTHFSGKIKKNILEEQQYFLIISQNTLIFSAIQLLDLDCNRTEKSILNLKNIYPMLCGVHKNPVQKI